MDINFKEFSLTNIHALFSNKYTSIIGLVEKLRRHVPNHNWTLTRGLAVDENTNKLDRKNLYRIYMDDEVAILFDREKMNICELLEKEMKGTKNALALSIVIDDFKKNSNPFYWFQPDVLRRDHEFTEIQEFINIKKYMLNNFETGSLIELHNKLTMYVPEYAWKLGFDTHKDYVLYIYADDLPIVTFKNDKCTFSGKNYINESAYEFNCIMRAFLDQTNMTTWYKTSRTKRNRLGYQFN